MITFTINKKIKGFQEQNQKAYYVNQANLNSVNLFKPIIMLLFKFAFIKKNKLAVIFYNFPDFSAKTLPSTSQKHLQR